jgi:hypothetical protein
MGEIMKSVRNSGVVGAVALATLLSMSVATGAGAVASTHSSVSQSVIAHVAKKTLVCYKAKLIKKVTAVSPKCPAGWTTKKPAAAKTAAFSGTYKGNISMLWSASDVKVTSLTGTGTGTNLGLTSVSGTGVSSPSNQCNPISGSGTLSGAGGTLKLKLATTSQGCGADSAAPTFVTITGSALVASGTGKFAGATGTLKVNGSFMIKSTVAGSNESDAFTVTLTGSLKLK